MAEPNGERINLGTYGNTWEASKSRYPTATLTLSFTLISDIEMTIQCTVGEHVTLTTPLTSSPRTAEFRFVHWLVDGQPQSYGQDNLELIVLDDHIIEAVYTLSGDATGSCTVGFEDLIFIRNRLGEDPQAPGNWAADVNSDQKIDILDLVYIRNRIGTTCSD